jgi:hypothetical protein
MVRQRTDGRYEITGTIPESLKEDVEDAKANNPELNDARLIRQGLRRELENHL